MTPEAGLLLFLYDGCVFNVREPVQPPKAGSVLFCRHLTYRTGDRVLEIGTGIGLAAVLAARAGCQVIATDILPAAVECAQQNAVLNGVASRMELRLGDCFDPVDDLTFDLICTSPPQMPTPPDRERDDPVATADNGGHDGWKLLDRVIEGADRHLRPGGRLVFTLFAFLGLKTAHAKLQAAGLEPSVMGRETQAFPRIGYERLDQIRLVDAERTLPATGPPTTVERYVVQGLKRGRSRR
jgi:release factor glutamine methyltransferase